MQKNIKRAKQFSNRKKQKCQYLLLREIILNYKFNDKSYLYKTIVNFLLKNEKIFEILKSYDTIIPVPISKKRKKERGYNQSALIAKEIVERLKKEQFTKKLATNKMTIEQFRQQNTQKIEYNDRCLFKTKNIIEQSKLNKQERAENIRGVYELRNKELLYNKKILLVDDIYTTGSTVDECSKILTDANPQKIGILTIAKD